MPLPQMSSPGCCCTRFGLLLSLVLLGLPFVPIDARLSLQGLKEKKVLIIGPAAYTKTSTVTSDKDIRGFLASMKEANNTNYLMATSNDTIPIDRPIEIGSKAYSNAIFFYHTKAGKPGSKTVTLVCRKASTAIIIRTSSTMLGNFDIRGCKDSAIRIEAPNPTCDRETESCDPPTFLNYVGLYLNGASSSAPANGGALHLKSGALVLDNVQMSRNRAREKGGAVFSSSKGCLILGQGSDDKVVNIFRLNSAKKGGAIYVDNNGCQAMLKYSTFPASITFSSFDQNTAEEGGALYLARATTFKEPLDILKVFFVNNKATTKRGSAVYFQGGAIGSEKWWTVEGTSDPLGVVQSAVFIQR